MNFSIDQYTLLLTLVAIVASLTVHEAMHALVGDRLGDSTAREEGRISLNPLRHIDPLTTVALPILTIIMFGAPILAAKPVPFNPARVRFEEFGAALIAAAGPLSNLVLAGVGGFLMRMQTSNGVGFDFLAIFTALNVSLFVFNTVPIPPLDGSRVLYAFAPEPVQEFMERIEPYGIFVVFGLVLLVPEFRYILNSISMTIFNALR